MLKEKLMAAAKEFGFEVESIADMPGLFVAKVIVGNVSLVIRSSDGGYAGDIYFNGMEACMGKAFADCERGVIEMVLSFVTTVKEREKELFINDLFAEDNEDDYSDEEDYDDEDYDDDYDKRFSNIKFCCIDTADEDDENEDDDDDYGYGFGEYDEDDFGYDEDEYEDEGPSGSSGDNLSVPYRCFSNIMDWVYKVCKADGVDFNAVLTSEFGLPEKLYNEFCYVDTAESDEVDKLLEELLASGDENIRAKILKKILEK